MRDFMGDLLACRTRGELKTRWLSLTSVQRADLRWNPILAEHAWAVLKTSNA